MVNYDNPTGVSPLLPPSGVPGISLPKDFALEPADRGLVPGPVAEKDAEAEVELPISPVRFPSRKISVYGKAIARFIGAFSGPGFNLIFRPHSDKTKDKKPKDDLLELNLTHELWTFPQAVADLGKVFNRVAKPGTGGQNRKDAILRGIPYTQIVRDVTNPDAGTRVRVDRLGNSINRNPDVKKLIQDIHFEPGLFMHIPWSTPVSDQATICRMASIPHGTTINAQGAPAAKFDGRPEIPKSSSMPFFADNSGPLDFDELDLTKDTVNGKTIKNETATRLPQNMKPFLDRKSAESITAEMVRDPNELLRKHNVDKNITEFIRFTVATTPSQTLEKQACPHLAARAALEATKVKALADIDAQITAAKSEDVKGALSEAKFTILKAIELCNEPTPIPGGKPTAPAIGTSNIAQLDGSLALGPNARTGKVESTFWISTVAYTVEVTEKFVPQLTDGKPTKDQDGKVLHFMQPLEPIEKLQLDPAGKKKFVEETIPSFVFPADQLVEAGKYSVQATQIQYSQTVNLIFNTLVWPHISVATLIPVRPVVVNFAEKLPN